MGLEEPRKPVIVADVGKSNSGKTTLIAKLIPVLKHRGDSGGTLQHRAHGFHLTHERLADKITAEFISLVGLGPKSKTGEHPSL